MNKFATSVTSGLGAMLGIAILAFGQTSLDSWQILMAPFGATAVLLYSAPQSPFSKPLNTIGGHVLTAVIGLIFVHYVGVYPWSLALATGVAVAAMMQCNLVHPPAGANPMLIMMAQPAWSFVIDPVLLGAVAMVLGAELIKRVTDLARAKGVKSAVKN